jgi:hypothetical protein
MEEEMRGMVEKTTELNNIIRYYQINIKRMSTQLEQEIAKPSYQRVNAHQSLNSS